jgi:hypothetical protein
VTAPHSYHLNKGKENVTLVSYSDYQGMEKSIALEKQGFYKTFSDIFFCLLINKMSYFW